MYINQVTVMGHLGKDPEIRTTQTGKKMATFSIATSEFYKDKSGQKQQQTQWHNIIAWGGYADSSEKFLKKGMNALVVGKLVYNAYQDKSGNKRTQTQIVAEKISFSFKEFKELNGDDQAEPNQLDNNEVENNKKNKVKKAKEVDDTLPF